MAEGDGGRHLLFPLQEDLLDASEGQGQVVCVLDGVDDGSVLV